MNTSPAQDPTFTKGQDVELHELAKGWKAAIARCNDPATRYVFCLYLCCLYHIHSYMQESYYLR